MRGGEFLLGVVATVLVLVIYSSLLSMRSDSPAITWMRRRVRIVWIVATVVPSATSLLPLWRDGSAAPPSTKFLAGFFCTALLIGLVLRWPESWTQGV